jgi:uncharacterized protein (DUF1330 family)
MASIDPIADQIEQIIADVGTKTGPIRMINPLEFREEADYGDATDPAEDGTSTGAEAYARYGEVAMAEVQNVGGSQFYAGIADMTVIGPESESWDLVAIVEYPNRTAFLEMISKPSYQACVFHRTAGLADTRIIMTTPL